MNGMISYVFYTISHCSVSSQLWCRRLSTLFYGLVNGKRNQEDPVKCAKTRVIITHVFDQLLRLFVERINRVVLKAAC